MADQVEAITVLIALEFIVVGGIVLLLVPFEVAAPIIPLLLVFLLALSPIGDESLAPYDTNR